MFRFNVSIAVEIRTTPRWPPMVRTYQKVLESVNFPIGKVFEALEKMARGLKSNYTKYFAMVRLSLGVKLLK
jgi:hypothetical protein